ncbi:hypothetical protein [Chitinophaga japonensis]|uniref:Uncharacterized protein n=1 Tax=Chitinophaga japonensis TaxID=104662 RepID=A0A562TCC3_CHIJA|nr:hypothetical protein [Chitinophaga japonensis]TWI90904.1 hypothetical protein LX66_0265 [Chitinophaga japonensis]
MFDIIHNTVVVKCPNPSCKANIQLSVGKVPGGVNDSGGWILECERCKTKFPYSVKNPDDYSSVEKGAKILDTWDNDIPDSKKEVLKKHGLESFPNDFSYENLLFTQTGEYEKTSFNDIEENIFFCPKCKTHLEPILYSQLPSKLPSINNAIKEYLNYYVKGSAGNPDSIIVTIDYKCSCGFDTKAVLYKAFKESELPIQEGHELILIDVLGADLEYTIDGIYNRDNCLSVLQKLLIRWQVYYNRVFLAVPFIGFDFKNSEAQRVELWNWILKNTLPHKTTLLTRKATLNSFLEGSANTGLDINVLKHYGLLNPTVDELTEKKALLKTDFHAKFYAGFDRKNAELLVGSFNIHEGGYVENIHFKSYAFGDFFSKYILKMNIIFDPRTIDEEGEFLFINENTDDKSFVPKVEKYTSSRREKIYELIIKS